MKTPKRLLPLVEEGLVDEVLRPNDPFKAYTAEDGSRYGLDDAWVAP